MRVDTTPYQENIGSGFLGDFLTRDHLLAGGIKIDAALFNSADAVKVVVGVAGAAADAVLVPVAALTAAIPSGTTIPFGGKKYATLTADAPKGAVSLAVSALATALVSGDTGYYNAPGAKKRIAAGTLVGATFTELEAAANTGLKWGPAADADDIVYIIAFDTPDADKNNDADVLRKGTLIKVNRLPGWANLSAALKGKVRATYETTVGAPGQEVPAV